MQNVRIVFFGTPRFALPSLCMLISRGLRPVAVVTQPDRRAGRGRQVQFSAVKQAALGHDLMVMQPERVRAPDFLDQFRELGPDLAVVAAYGQLFSRSLLDIPRFGFINVHSSLLPAYRGAAPINWAIINGERETGVTIMQVELEMDSGPIILQHPEPIAPDDTAASLHDRLAELGGRLLGRALDQFAGPGWQPVEQQHAAATYAPQLKKNDGLIDWSLPAAVIDNRLRGMTPWPGCFTLLDGRMLKLSAAAVQQAGTDRAVPGTVLRADDQGLAIATGDGVLIIAELQLEGKKRISAGEFLKGTCVQAGAVLGKDASAA